jgi:hypothetical protein
MKRRYIIMLGGVIAGLPLAAYAQQGVKMARVGRVDLQPRTAPFYGAFERRMAELGYQEGQNFAFAHVQYISRALKVTSRDTGGSPRETAYDLS